MVKSNYINGLQEGDISEPLIKLLSTHRRAFTLAEVLITIAIIGIVAAMTIPSLISSFQKKIYYSKFMKARMVIENAMKLYANDTGCEDGACGNDSKWNPEFFKEFPKYFNIKTFITEDNYQEICKKYDKVAINYDGSNVSSMHYLCAPDDCGDENIKKGYAFITQDGMMFNFCSQGNIGNESTVDTNGPDNGPNIIGRDIFYFIIKYKNEVESSYCGNMWGTSKACRDTGVNPGTPFTCYGNDKQGWNCGARLIEEGKMNY